MSSWQKQGEGHSTINAQCQIPDLLIGGFAETFGKLLENP